MVTYDLLGHGKSSRPQRGYSLEAMADDLARVVQWASTRPVHLVGLSLGGMIAQAFALAHGNSVASLTLVDTVATLTPEARHIMRQRASLVRGSGMAAIVQPTIDRWFTSAFAARQPAFVDRLRRTLLANDSNIHATIWDEIAVIDLADRLHAIECPVQVLVGEHDATTPIAASRLIASAIRHSHLYVLPGLSHMTPLEGPEEVNRLLLSFINSQKSSSDL